MIEAATADPSKPFARPQLVATAPGVGNGAQPEVATSSRGAQFLVWLAGPEGASEVDWSMAAPGSARFGGPARLARVNGFVLTQLYRGRRGAMLATVGHQSTSSADTRLFTYGER
jgi:hypothetical protein